MDGLDKLIELLEAETSEYNEKFHEWYSGINYALTKAHEIKQSGLNTGNYNCLCDFIDGQKCDVK